ncbi:MAG: type IV pilus secretin PilQ [Nitrospirota bacterium]
MMLALGCAVQSVNRDAAPERDESQIRFHVQTLPNEVQVEVQGESPLVYTAFRLPDPPRLIIDLAGVSFAPDQQSVAVNNGAVARVNPAVTDARVARLEIALTQLVDYQLRPDGTRLLVAIAAPSEAAQSDSVEAGPLPDAGQEPASSAPEVLVPPVAESSPAEPPAAASPKPTRDATVVKAVRVESHAAPLQVKIQGDGAFRPTTMMLEGPRLVIDLPGTSSQVGRSKVAVNEPPLKQIRIGEHTDPQKVRIVLDLTAVLDYRLDQQGDTLTVALSPARPLPGAASSPRAKAQPSPEQTTNAGVALPVPPRRQKAASAQLETPEEANGQTTKESSAVATDKKFTGRRISLDFQEADLDDVLRLMADVSGLNIVVAETVKGKVTVKLLNVPWDQALDLILRTHGLGQVREGNILRIDTLANLSKQQDEEARAKESAVRAEDIVTRVMYVNYAEAKNLVTTLEKSLSSRGDITIDERTNALIVKDIEKKTEEVTALLKVLDTKTPQVLIEARIVTADSNFARDLGVQWGGQFRTTSGPYQFGGITGPSGGVSTGGTGAGSTPTPGFLVNLPASGQAGSVGNLGFTFGRLTSNPIILDLRLSAGEKQGLSKTISSPKVLVLDNQDAKIEQGTSIPFQTTSQQGTQTTFIDANLVLEVTPHVTPDGSVLMKLRVANNEPDFANPTPAGPPIKKKEAKTNILIKDGETAVLGGIYVSTKADTVSGVPFLYKIPIIGWLFKQTSKSDATTELLVFLTPKILT